MLRDKRQIIGKQSFRAKFDKSTINVDARTIDVVFVTERQVMMYNWDLGLFYEVLPCNDQAGDLTRLNNGGPLCDTHDTSSVKNALGVCEKAWFENGVGRATVRFAKIGDAEDVWKNVQDGIITGVSVGYLVYEYEEVGIKDNFPLIRANKWEAHEISLALVQADVDSGVGRSEANEITHDVVLIRKNLNTNIMTEAEKKAALAAERKRSSEIFMACRTANLSDEFAQELVDSEKTIEECRTAIATKKAEAAPASKDEERAQAAQAERTRISEINKTVRMVGLPETFAEKLINDGTSLDSARAAIIDEAHKANEVEPKHQSGVRAGADEKDKKQRGMEASLLMRTAGGLFPDAHKDAGEFRGMRLMDLAKECLDGAGISHRGMSQMDIAKRALQMGARDGAGLATGDFPYLLANALNKTLRKAYQLQDATFRPWATKSTNSDFKLKTVAALNDIKLEEVQENGEYKFAASGDTGEAYKLKKFGKLVRISWEAVINDDLSAFSRFPSLMAGSVAQMQADAVYAVLTGSHKMSDNVELFHADHGNLTGSGTVINVANLGIGRQKMREQKSPGGNFLNVAPKFLIVGPALEAVALQYTSQQYVSAKSSDINVWAGMLTPIVDARITGNAWYLSADPNLFDTVEYSTLDGEDYFTDTRYGFEVDALEWKVRSAFAAKAIDWRGVYKNVGA